MSRETREAEIAGEVVDFIKQFKGIKKYNVFIRPSAQGSKILRWHVRNQLIVQLWVNKEEFETIDVTLKLVGKNSFKEEIKKINGGVMSLSFDIYE